MAARRFASASAATRLSAADGSAGARAARLTTSILLDGGFRVVGDLADVDGNLAAHRVLAPVRADLKGVGGFARVFAAHPGVGLFMGADLAVAGLELGDDGAFLFGKLERGAAGACAAGIFSLAHGRWWRCGFRAFALGIGHGGLFRAGGRGSGHECRMGQCGPRAREHAFPLGSYPPRDPSSRTLPTGFPRT